MQRVVYRERSAVLPTLRGHGPRRKRAKLAKLAS